jgi:hypothetical protein
VSSDRSFDTGRFARTLTLILFVTVVFLFLATERLSGELFQIGAVVLGTVAVVSAIISFLIATTSAYEA